MARRYRVILRRGNLRPGDVIEAGLNSAALVAQGVLEPCADDEPLTEREEATEERTTRTTRSNK